MYSPYVVLRLFDHSVPGNSTIISPSPRHADLLYSDLTIFDNFNSLLSTAFANSGEALARSFDRIQGLF
jgi:hypothetical protein